MPTLVADIQGATIKNNPIGKALYPRNTVNVAVVKTKFADFQ